LKTSKNNLEITYQSKILRLYIWMNYLAYRLKSCQALIAYLAFFTLFH